MIDLFLSSGQKIIGQKISESFKALFFLYKVLVFGRERLLSKNSFTYLKTLQAVCRLSWVVLLDCNKLRMHV